MAISIGNQTIDPITDTYSSTGVPDPTTAVVANCTGGSPAIWSSLGMCLENPLQYIAFLFAIASLCFWLVSHIVLLRARHLEGNASRRHFLTLIHICSANLCNVIGAALCGQLGTQVLIAGYLVGSDVIFFIHFLFVWYTFKPRQSDGIPYSEWKSPDQARGKQNGNRTRIMCILLTWLPAMLYMPLASSPWQPERMQTFGHGRKLLMVTESSLDNFGFTLGVIAVLAYGLAKVPLVKDGLLQSEYLLRHFPVINFNVLAHICYVLSVILFSQDLAFLINALPWLFISGVCTLFDVIIVYLIARQHRRIAREKAAARWEDSRDPRVRAYEDDGREDGSGLNDDGDEGWVPRQVPRLAAIHEDEENAESDEPQSTQADMTYTDSDRRVDHYADAQKYASEDVTGQRSPIQALLPPPQHPRGGRSRKMPSKATADDSFGGDLEWDLSDMSKTYKEDDEDNVDDEEDEDVIWDEELILKEVEDELKRRETDGQEIDPYSDHVSDISVKSLEFEEIPVDGEMIEDMQDEWFDS